MYTNIKQFYKSRAWQACRASYWKKAKGMCERCLVKGLYVIALNFQNLELLCKKCHEEEHHGVKRYKVDKRTGAVIPLPEE